MHVSACTTAEVGTCLTSNRTPWLTTRRRTCPICKGDVVRSMAQGNSPTDRRETTDHRTEDVQTRAAEARNDSPTAAIPVPRLLDDDDDSDVERGDVNSESGASQNESPTPSAQRSSWMNIASLNFSARVAALSGDSSWRQSQSDRSR